MAYATEVYKTKAEQDARYEALRDIPHVVRYSEHITRPDNSWFFAWCIGYPADTKLPTELRLNEPAPPRSDEEIPVEQSSTPVDRQSPALKT